jgi:predicted nucleotidyltransferase
VALDAFLSATLPELLLTSIHRSDGEPMASVQEIRQRLRGQRIESLRSRIEPLLAGQAGAEVWLFGSLARGDWDARSDVDLLAVAPDQSAADQLADALLGWERAWPTM